MSGIARAGLSANELLAPQEFWQKQQQVNAYTQGVGLQAQHQERELEDHDQAQIANVAGYLLSQPEEKRADAWANIYQGLPDHIRSRAPSSYMGEQWLQGAYNRAIPAAERWKQAQLTAGTDSILRSVGGGGGASGGAPGGPGVAGGGAPAGGAPPATAYATAAPAVAPPALMPYFQEASKETGIPVERLIAQARQESNFDANATGGAGERGIMQIHPRTAAAPGFGMQPIDPAALTDPRSNIMWGARYLKARMGGGDPTDPNVWTRGLAGYNGGGDPNYVQNVTRYLAPPGGGPAPAPAPAGGVAARTGGVDVAGPGAPPDSAMAPDVRARVMAAAGGPPNTLLQPEAIPAAPPAAAPAAPGAVPAEAPAAPAAAPAPAAPAAPQAPARATPEPPLRTQQQVEAGLRLNEHGLTQADLSELSAARLPQAQLMQAIASRQEHNRATVQHVLAQDQRQHENWRETERDRLAADKEAAAAPLRKAQLEKAQSDAQAAGKVYPGTGADAASRNILIEGSKEGGDTSSIAFRNAWADLAYHESTDGQTMIERDMSMFKRPTNKDGSPADISAPKVTQAPTMPPQPVVASMLTTATGQNKIQKALGSLSAYPQGVGAGNLQPNWLTQRTDPAGVRLRADIADVSGHILHDLAGSAQSKQEAERLAPFLPKDTDTEASVRSNLGRMMEINRETMLQQYRTYGPDGGGRRMPVVEEAILGSIPQAAIDLLKEDRSRAGDFDKKYGRGTSKLVLQ
jgi:hypothetical protein